MSLLPDNPNVVANFWKKYISNTKALIILVLLISTLAHGINMFRFPYFEDDEGTYMSQAWSLVTQGRLSPYYYTYDHAPAGWIFIAIWTLITGGFFSFGFSLNSGRAFMLILNIFSNLFLFFIARRLTKNSLISALSVLIFSLSPLGIYFQRRILLDNIMTFWVLASLMVLVSSKINSKKMVLSGILFGIALVTKETAIFFLPGFLYLIYYKNKKNDLPKMSFKYWLIPFLVPVLIYLLYALSRGELFPYGTILGGTSPHVSLIGTVLQQLSRTGSMQSFKTWFLMDPILIVIGMLSVLTNLILGFNAQNILNRIVSFFAIFYGLYLLRGGLIFEFYIVPILPFLALNIVVTVWYLFTHILKTSFQKKLSLAILTLLMFFDLGYFGSHSKLQYNLFTSNQTLAQTTAVNWILSQNQPSAFYVIDNYAYVDLHAKQDSHLKYAEYYWKVEEDPSVYSSILKNDWRNINYIAATPQLISDVTNNNLKFNQSALKNSKLIQEFLSDGWGVNIWQVNP